MIKDNLSPYLLNIFLLFEIIKVILNLSCRTHPFGEQVSCHMIIQFELSDKYLLAKITAISITAFLYLRVLCDALMSLQLC